MIDLWALGYYTSGNIATFYLKVKKSHEDLRAPPCFLYGNA